MFIHSTRDIMETAATQIAESPLANSSPKVGQRKADHGTSVRIGIQHDHKPGLDRFISRKGEARILHPTGT